MMTPERFCDWLNGYVELDGELPSKEQWEMIKEHLGLVYDKVTSTKEELSKKTAHEIEDSIITPLPKRGFKGDLLCSSAIIC